MPKIVIPLGVIIDTDVTRSLNKFQRLCNQLKLNVDITRPALLEKLNLIFANFNKGLYTKFNGREYSVDIMGLVLLFNLENFLSEDVLARTDWRDQWQAAWQECWNAMCVVDERALSVVRILQTNPDFEIIIYSETNPLHHESIRRQIEAEGLTMPNLLTTYEKQKSHQELLSDILSIEPQDTLVVIGNPSRIAHPTFKALAETKVANVRKLVQESNTTVFELSDKVMQPEDFALISEAANELRSASKVMPKYAPV